MSEETENDDADTAADGGEGEAATPSDQPAPAASSKVGSGSTTGKQFVPPTPQELDAVLEQYEFLEIIGIGGMGAVYKARQPKLNRLVAIKVLPAHLQIDDDEMNFAGRFMQEAQAMAKLTHPHILHVYDFGETDDGQLYIVMEFADGTDLHQLIRGGDLTLDHFYGWIPQICDALQYAHSEGIIHRDIKPSNVMITNKGEVKIADFGLAKLTDSESGRSTSLTATNVAMGTPDYVAPEQLIAGASVDHRADLYSIGVLLYEMLTGGVPRGRFKRPSEKIPGLDARLDDVVFKAMEESPEERFQNAGEISTAISKIRKTPPGSTAPVMVKKRPTLLTGPVQANAVGTSSAPKGATSPVNPSAATATRSRGRGKGTKQGKGKLIGIAVVLGLVAIATAVMVSQGDGEKGNEGGEPSIDIVEAHTPKSIPKPEATPEPISAPKPEHPPADPETKPPSPEPTPKPPATEPITRPPAQDSAPKPTLSSNEPKPKTKPLPTSNAAKPPPPSLPPAEAPIQSEIDRRLSEVENQFRQRYRNEILAGHDTRVAALDKQYLSALGRIEDAASQAANLDEVLLIRKEQERVETGAPFPETDDPKALPTTVANLRKTYRTQFTKLEQTREAGIQKLVIEYDQVLDGVQRAFTKQAKIDEALKVKAVREALKNDDRGWLGEDSGTGEEPQKSAETAKTSAPDIPRTKEELKTWLEETSWKVEKISNGVATEGYYRFYGSEYFLIVWKEGYTGVGKVVEVRENGLVLKYTNDEWEIEFDPAFQKAQSGTAISGRERKEEWDLVSRDPNFRGFQPLWRGSYPGSWLTGLTYISVIGSPEVTFGGGNNMLWDGNKIPLELAGDDMPVFTGLLKGNAIRVVFHDEGRWLHVEGEALQGPATAAIWIRKDIHDEAREAIATRGTPQTAAELETLLAGTVWARTSSVQDGPTFNRFFPNRTGEGGSVKVIEERNGAAKRATWNTISANQAQWNWTYGRFIYQFSDDFSRFEGASPDGGEKVWGALIGVTPEDK